MKLRGIGSGEGVVIDAFAKGNAMSVLVPRAGCTFWLFFKDGGLRCFLTQKPDSLGWLKGFWEENKYIIPQKVTRVCFLIVFAFFWPNTRGGSQC